MTRRKLSIILLLIGFFFPTSLARSEADSEIDETVKELMAGGDIPGLSLVILRPGKPDVIKGFGVADLDSGKKVSPDTLFETGSCSKSFTALAALQLAQKGKFNLDDPVSRHLPWFYVTYENQKYDITIRQALHHTTGIPWNTIKAVPPGNQDNALEQTVRNIAGVELEEEPGTLHRYATVNYDIIGLIIEKVSGLSYERYMSQQVFKPLGLSSTTTGLYRKEPAVAGRMATGYKTGFFAARKYQTPPFRGNTPAGYIISSARDMARWLKYQLELEQHPLTPLIRQTRERDDTVSPNPFDMSSYAMGWRVSLTGNKEIYHGGFNPNYTAYMAFRPDDKTAVAVLANSNSNYTVLIGKTVMNMLYGTETGDIAAGDATDKAASVISILLGLYISMFLAYLIYFLSDLIKGRRKFETLTWKKAAKIVLALPVMLPFLVGIYLLPFAMKGVPWQVALVWSPVSFKIAIILLLACFALSYLGFILAVLFPQDNKYLKSLPRLLMLSMLTGGANAVVIFLITGSLYAQNGLLYMLYYFLLAISLAVIGRKIVQTKLTRLTFDIIYDMRMQLTEKIFYTSYQKFEKLDPGRIFSTMNNDTGQIGNSANMFVAMLTSIITVIGAFLYLSTIAFWATLTALGAIIFIAAVYYVTSQKSTVYLEDARDTQTIYMRLLNGLVEGFKELSIRFLKKKEYRSDIEKSTDQFRNKTVTAMVKFIDAQVIGESMMLMVLGCVAFAVPRLFPHVNTFTLVSFIMVLLYLIGPINSILTSIPQIMQLRVAWNRVKGFIRDIPANMNPEDLEKLQLNITGAKHIEARGLMFKYQGENEDESFTLGPVDFEARAGEAVFIIGGNGSGKTTLAKLLTGLYLPDQGSVKIDDKEISTYQLGEYYSTIFSDYHLFEKLYSVDLKQKKAEALRYLKLLRLTGKVSLEGDSFSTIKLSGGQRKRLALLQCFLEDSPVFLFDEVAADQDPEFRRFFYRELLVQMKERGKIVIAITHDDHYFEVADKVIKMDLGKIEKEL